MATGGQVLFGCGAVGGYYISLTQSIIDLNEGKTDSIDFGQINIDTLVGGLTEFAYGKAFSFLWRGGRYVWSPILKKVTPASSSLDWSDISVLLRHSKNTKGNHGIGKFTAKQADQLGKAWVGEGYVESTTKPGVYLSKDGLKQYRSPTFKPKLGITQANLDWRSSTSESFISGKKGAGGNAHMGIID